MRPGEIDWQIIRAPLIVLLSSVVLSIVLIGASHYFHAEMQRHYQIQKSRLDAVRGSYYTVDEEEQIIQAYLPKYRALQVEGVIGEEQRLSWVEALRKAAKSIKLPALSYEITSREQYAPDFAVDAGTFEVYASEMKLKLGLLHEGDLDSLLDALEEDAAGLYTVTGCDISRRSREFSLDPTAENIGAECRLRWYTIALPEESAS